MQAFCRFPRAAQIIEIFGNKKHAPWKKSGTIASTLVCPARQMMFSFTLDATSWCAYTCAKVTSCSLPRMSMKIHPM